ncbi:MAG: Asp23/Gls24 family envelope stress response protein [Lachnospiraceae bacterium]|nr:Asp23/Gls24 family envelope stress response protein [Lachnospiraceae bacterium]
MNSVSEKFGHVRIADNVIACIAGLAATDVKGVVHLYGGIKHDEVTKVATQVLERPVRIAIHDGQIEVKIAISVNATFPMPEVTKKVQEKVKSSIEMMTGNEVRSVDVTVAEVLL